MMLNVYENNVIKNKLYGNNSFSTVWKMNLFYDQEVE